MEITVSSDSGAIGEGGAGAHPDLATHTGLGLAAAHAHPYKPGQHAAQGHTGAAVADGSTLPPYIVVHMWKRTA